MPVRASAIQIINHSVITLITGCTLLLLAGCGTPGGNANPLSHYQISGAGKTGPLSIQRVELNFARGQSSITVKKGNKIEAVAQIKYQGTGVLSASWMVDDLIVEQLNLSLSHGSLLTLSPKPSTQIASFNPGQHYLRLQINHPKVDFKQPKLSFFIVSQ